MCRPPSRAYAQKMVSKTSLSAAVRRFDVAAVTEGLAQRPRLLGHRDGRGRNWLHLTASICLPDHPELAAEHGIELAEHLIALGLQINGPAFSEGTWEATPLWYAVARGRNLSLARWLLDAGATPEHCLWAAAYRDDLAMLHLLLERGAPLEAVADPDYVDSTGMTALHYLLKKGSDREHVELLARHGARGDIAGPDGRTAIEILANKRSPAFKALAERLTAG